MKYFFPLCRLDQGESVLLARIDGIYLEEILWDANDNLIMSVIYEDGLCQELVLYWIKMCKMQVVVDALSYEDALSFFYYFKAELYARGVAPFISPIVSNYSFKKLFDKNSINGTEMTINILEYSLSTAIVMDESEYVLKGSSFINSALNGKKYSRKYKGNVIINNLIKGVLVAPTIKPKEQSYLHIWSVIESVFPYVSSEISFKLSLYISHMSFVKNIRYYDMVKKSYTTRCKLSHGGLVKLSDEDWMSAWSILLNILQTVLYNGGIFEERQMLEKIFTIDRYVI